MSAPPWALHSTCRSVMDVCPCVHCPVLQATRPRPRGVCPTAVTVGRVPMTCPPGSPVRQRGRPRAGHFEAEACGGFTCRLPSRSARLRSSPQRRLAQAQGGAAGACSWVWSLPPCWGLRASGWELAQPQRWEDREGFQGHLGPQWGHRLMDLDPPSVPVCGPQGWPSAAVLRFGVWMMLWVELCPPKRYVHVLTPTAVKGTLFGNGVSVYVFELR